MEVYIVYIKGYRENTLGYPQGIGNEVIEEIISVRATEDAAKDEVRNSMSKNLSYVRKIVK